MVIEHYVDDPGQITFYLHPGQDALDALPPEIRSEAADPEREGGTEFCACLDCRTLGWKFLWVFHEMEATDAGDMYVNLPHDARKRAIGDISEWCRDELGGDILEIADRQLGEAGETLSVKDCMERIRNLSFGETVSSARKLYCEDEAFGNAMGLEFNEFLPRALEKACEVLQRNGLGRIFLERAPLEACAASLRESEDDALVARIEEEQDNLQRISGSEMEALQGMDGDIQRYSVDFILSPRLSSLTIQFMGHDSDDVGIAWIGLEEMKRVADALPDAEREKPKARQPRAHM